MEHKRHIEVETKNRNSKRQWYQGPTCGQTRTPNSGFQSLALVEGENLTLEDKAIASDVSTTPSFWRSAC